MQTVSYPTAACKIYIHVPALQPGQKGGLGRKKDGFFHITAYTK